MLCWNVQQWRRRYFVLYAPPASSGVPDPQYNTILQYFDNDRQTKKKGSIDLTRCEEVLCDMKYPHYPHVFCLRTKHFGRDRTYYLAADSEDEMNLWVSTLCRVLHLDHGCEWCAVPVFIIYFFTGHLQVVSPRLANRNRDF